MKAIVRINSLPPSEADHSPYFPYRTIDVIPVVIPGVGYQYFVVHQVVKSDGVFKHAFAVTEYQTGVRVSPVEKFAYSVEQVVEQTAKRFADDRIDDEIIHRRIDVMLERYGRANEITPADWPD